MSRARKDKLKLTPEFAEQNGEEIKRLYDELHAIVSTDRSTGIQLRDALNTVVAHPFAPIVLRMPMKDHFEPEDSQIGQSAIFLVEEARMVFDPAHRDFVAEIEDIVDRGMNKPFEGETGYAGFRGEGWEMLKESIRPAPFRPFGPPMRS